MAEDFLLKWNDHHTLFFAGAEQLYQGEEFTDVVISAGSQTFKAHKLVLSICSPYFQNLFRKLGPEKHVIFLKDISAKHLELLLQYMYMGEIKVQEDELVTVLNVAQSLEIRGLTDNSDSKPTPSSSNTRKSADLPPIVKRRSPPPQSSSVQTAKRPRPMEQQRSQPFTPSLVKMEHDTTPVIDVEDHGVDGGGYNPDMGDGNSFQGAAPGVLATEEGYEGYEEGYDQGEGGYYDAHADKGWDIMDNDKTCHFCGKVSSTRKDLQKHLLTHTDEKPYACRYCGVGFKDPSNKLKHERRIHGLQT